MQQLKQVILNAINVCVRLIMREEICSVPPKTNTTPLLVYKQATRFTV